MSVVHEIVQTGVVDGRAARPLAVPKGGHELFVRDMTATFATDVSLARAWEMLAPHEQWLPADGDASLSFSELIGRNTTGPLRIGFGGWRDLLLGAQFYNGRGELISAGGRTLKNVAGYDLTKLMVGQCGGLGRLATVTLRTCRLPEFALCARFDPRRDVLTELLVGDCRPQWAALVKSDGIELLCGYLGDGATIDHLKPAIEAHGPSSVDRQSLAEDIELRRGIWCATAGDHWRISVPPARLLELLERLPRAAADATFGIAIVAGGLADARDMRGLVKAVGGAAWHYDSAGVHIPANTSAQGLLRKLKAAFDPDETFGKLKFLDEPAEGE